MGLQKQLSKLDNSSLNTTNSTRNHGFIFDEHLTSDQNKSHHFLSPAILISVVHSAESVVTLEIL